MPARRSRLIVRQQEDDRGNGGRCNECGRQCRRVASRMRTDPTKRGNVRFLPGSKSRIAADAEERASQVWSAHVGRCGRAHNAHTQRYGSIKPTALLKRSPNGETAAEKGTTGPALAGPVATDRFASPAA